MQKNIENYKKTVLVTGSSRGIGRECIIEFAKEGYNVVINYNNSEKRAEELKNYLNENFNVEVLSIKADIKEENEVKVMIEKIINRFGKIDVLVNNAGIETQKPFEEREVKDFEKTFAVNVFGTFLVTKYVSKHMMNLKKGNIINIASTSGYDSYSPLSIDYDASKAAVISLTHDFAIQFQPYIRVNAIAPGWVKTEMNETLGENFYEEEKEKILLNKIGNTQEIASLVVFLASEKSSYINNEVIKIDGGTY